MKKWLAHAMFLMLVLSATLGALTPVQAGPGTPEAQDEQDETVPIENTLCSDLMGPLLPEQLQSGCAALFAGAADPQGILTFAHALCAVPDFQQGCEDAGFFSSGEDEGEEPHQPVWDAARPVLPEAVATVRGALAPTDGVWDTVQKTAFDPVFEQMYLAVKTALETAQPSLFEVDENTQNGDTEPLDRDQDGSTDAYRIKYRASANNNYKPEDTVWLQADYMWDFSEQQAMLVDRQTGEGRVTGFNITSQGNDLYLTIINNTNAPDPWGHIILNATASTETDARDFVILNVVHEKDRYVSVPDGTWVAPIDLYRVVFLRHGDTDGDGFEHGIENTPAAQYNYTISNPFNVFSVPGDADADGCFFPRDIDDTDPEINPCDVFAFIFDVIPLDVDPLDEGSRVWGTSVPVNLDILDDPQSAYVGPETDVTSWRVFYTQPIGNQNEIGTICDDSSGLIWEPPGLTCVWDSTEADDNVDTQHGTYLAKIEVCIAGIVEEVCHTTDGVPFEVANKAEFKYVDVHDLISGDGDDDRDGWMSDVILFNFTASHPEYDIVAFNITAKTCTGTGNGISCPGDGDITPENSITYLIDADDPRLTPPADPTGNWTFTHDSSPYPTSDATSYNGVKYRVKTYTNAPHDKTERVGERGEEAFGGSWPFCAGSSGSVQGKKVFNNRPPEVTDLSVTIETPSSEQSDQQRATLGFHYRDRDNRAATNATVWVEGPGFAERVDNCEAQGLAGTFNSLIDTNPAVAIAGVSSDTSDIDYLCSWDSQGRLGNFTWHVDITDGDRNHNRTNQSSAPIANIITENLIPVLSQPSVEAKATNPPGAESGVFSFKVHYSDSVDAPEHVGVVLERVDATAPPIEKEMLRCMTQSSLGDNLDTIESIAGPLPLASKRDGEFCADVALPRGSVWEYRFEAEDLRGGQAVLEDPEEFLIEVLEAICGHCAEKADAFTESQTVFRQTITDLNSQEVLALTPHGGDLWRETALGLPDSDGDFIPDFMEHWILETNIFEVLADDGNPATPDSALLANEWVIHLKHHRNLFNNDGTLLEIRINSDGDHLVLNVCPFKEETELANEHTTVGPCLIESRELSEVEFAITTMGFWIEAVGPTEAREMLFVVDLAQLGSETEPIVYAEFGAVVKSPTNGAATPAGSNFAILSHPFQVLQEGAEVGPPLPAGIKVNEENGNYVLYQGETEQEVDTNSLDMDGDGYPDQTEILICVTPGMLVVLGGSCNTENTDYRPG